MPYTRTIKINDVAITNAIDCQFNLGAFGGCLGGTLVLPGTVRDDYAHEVNDVVECYYDAADLTPVYRGVVTTRSKSLNTHMHTYIIEGTWQKAQKTVVSSENIFTNTTVGAIITWLASNGLSALYDTADIATSSIAVDNYEVSADTTIADVASFCAMMASATTPWACGFDASNSFYFKAIPASIQGTATIGQTAAQATEDSEQITPDEKIILIGDDSKTTGYRTRRSFGTGKPINIRVRGIRCHDDFQRFKTGWDQCYSTIYTVSDLYFVQSSPLPWAGKLTYNDYKRDASISEFFTAVRVQFNTTYNFNAQLGLRGKETDPFTQDGNPYSPTALRSSRGIGGSREIESREYGTLPDLTDPDPSLTTPVAGTDFIAPATDDLFKVNEEILKDALKDSPVGVQAREVVDFMYPGGFEVDSVADDQDDIHMIAIIANGGDEALLDEESDGMGGTIYPVRFRIYQYDVLDQNIGNYLANATLADDSNGREIYYIDNNDFPVINKEAGYLLIAVEVIQDDDSYKAWPSNPAEAGGQDKCPRVRVTDKAVGGGAGANVTQWSFRHAEE